MNELGKPYDYGAYPRLLFKAIIGDWIDTVAGWKWADWCTEGVHRAYMANEPSTDLFQTANPTPLTLEQISGIAPLKFGKKVTMMEVK
jgi:hypothetical protein